MKRERVTPRPGWPQDCEAIGFSYHSIDGPYWDESHCYRFAADEIDRLEAAAAELQARCLDAVDHIVRHDRYDLLRIPAQWRERVASSWSRREASLFGRFDLAYDGTGAPKLLEYNADTPTALLEAAVAQWRWLEQVVRPHEPQADQFNSLHEKLIARFRALAQLWPAHAIVHFACTEDSEEDRGNLEYLRDVAIQGGCVTRFIAVDAIGWDRQRRVFVDDDEREIRVLFKLYPWEWMAAERFGEHLRAAPMTVVEPAWKMLLSNKGILPVLWELFPGHPNLLPAYFEPGRLAGDWVRKPLLSREGANVTMHVGGREIAAGGDYGAEGWVYQQHAALARFGDDHATLGAWIVGAEPAGLGIREDASPITRNTSRFVPHYFI